MSGPYDCHQRVPCPFVAAVKGAPWPIKHHVDAALVFAAASMRGEEAWTDRAPFEGVDGPRGSASYYFGGARIARSLVRGESPAHRRQRDGGRFSWAISGECNRGS